MTYKVSSGTLNLCSINQSIDMFVFEGSCLATAFHTLTVCCFCLLPLNKRYSRCEGGMWYFIVAVVEAILPVCLYVSYSFIYICSKECSNLEALHLLYIVLLH